MGGSKGRSNGHAAAAEPARGGWAHVAHYLLSVSAFVFCGPMLILLNSALLKEHGFPYPIALSGLGVFFCALLARLLLGLGLVRFTRPELLADRRFFVRNVLPIASLSALTLALGNAAYVHLSVAMCQVLKSLTPAITLLVLYALRVEEPSLPVIGCVLLITSGTLIAVRGELSLSRRGLALQLGANLSEACRIVLAQRLLSNLRLPLLEMQYHVAPYQFLCLVLASAALEFSAPDDRAAGAAAFARRPELFLGAGLLGFLLQVAGLLVVKVAGSVAVKLLGIVRGAALVVFEVVFGSVEPGREPLSPVQLAGYFASLAGFVAYNLLRLGQVGVSPSKKAD